MATAAALFAHAPVSAQEAPKWGAHIDVEGKLGTERDLGEVDLFLPLAQSGRTLLFSDIRARADDEGSHEGNFGLGLRHMHASGWNFGLYGYYDRRGTDLDNYFNQATIGVEALGRDFDFRANAYLPFGDRVKDTGSTPGGGTSASIVGTTIQVTTLGATLSEERALEGFDAEVGWRVPLWSVDDNKALRLYAGMFHFDDSVVEAVTGPRLRAELTMYELPSLPEDARLTLGAEYQDDDVRGSQGFVSARLRIPLQADRSSARRLNWQERRMTDYVVRDVDIVTEARTVKAADIVETATETAGGDAITVLDSGTTSGANLQSALVSAGNNSIAILQGTFVTTATTVVQSGQTVMGAGTLTVQTATGRTATLTTTGATVNMNGATAVFDMSTASTLSGMTIDVTGTNGAIGVTAFGINGVVISNNTISASGSNNDVFALGLVNSSITVSGNDLSATSTAGNYASALFTNSGTYTVTGNTFNASGGNITRGLNLQNGPTFNAGSTGNTLASGGCYSNGGVAGTIGLVGGATCP